MIGQTISHYNILEKLGEGGMGIVYKAQDTKLNRTVALKFLPEHIASSEKDAARFMQEAQAAAALNHPNICTIYGIEEADSPSTLREPQGRTEQSRSATQAPGAPSLGARHFIVMEFVDGQTLQEKKSSLSTKQALDIGIQIAEGLAAAHEKGVVHRDIKPENIMIRKDGRVQIMDFGLAKLRGASRLTKEGSTVGTAGYMSPEQVQGQETDHRSDIFSLGVLLYEMLTGQVPFKGVHETAIAYEIVNVDSPPMSSIKPEIPPELDAIILECLEKDPKERAQSASQISVDLKRYRRESSRSRVSRMTGAGPAYQSSSTQRPSPGIVAPSESRDRSLFSRASLIVMIVGTLLVVTFLLLWTPWESGSPDSASVTRTIVPLQEGYELNLNYSGSSVDISPDGRMLAYNGWNPGPGRSQLFIRSLDNFESKPLLVVAGSDIMFSPDGQWIVYSRNGILNKVSINGGAPVKISTAGNPRGMGWGPDGSIYLSDGQVGGVARIHPAGDSLETITTPDTSRGELSHRFPSVLPNGKTMILTVKYKTTVSFDDAVIAVHDMETGKRKTLIEGGSYARYVSTGHIVYVRKGSLFAVPFDAESLELTGPTRELFSGGMLVQESGAASFAFSKTGTLVYAPGGPAPSQMYSIEWMTHKGETTPLIKTPGAYASMALSPDRTKLAVTINAANNDVWTYDMKRATMQRLTFGGGNHGSPSWSPDGRKVAYVAERGDQVEIYWRAWDGSGTEEKLIGEKGYVLGPAGFSPGGKYFLYYRQDKEKSDLWALPLKETGEPFPVLQTASGEFQVKISPDERWIAYVSNESGTWETYVVPFPRGEGKWQISSGGSNGHWWSNSGSEIYYFDSDEKLMSVPVQRGASLDPGTPRMLSDLSALKGTHFRDVAFDPIGMRWPAIKALPGAKSPMHINVVTGWFNELKKNQ